MLIGGDDISNDVITLGTCFSMFVYIRARFPFGGNLTAQSTGSHRGIGGGFKFQRRNCKLSFLFPPCRQFPPKSLLAAFRKSTIPLCHQHIIIIKSFVRIPNVLFIFLVAESNKYNFLRSLLIQSLTLRLYYQQSPFLYTIKYGFW